MKGKNQELSLRIVANREHFTSYFHQQDEILIFKELNEEKNAFMHKNNESLNEYLI